MAEIDWNLIRSFVAVAETGSLSAAARRLAASQPTLGRHISELEQALGVTLFRRGRTGYLLTEAGSLLFERGRAVSEEATAFSRLALGSVEAIEGTVRIAASEIVATCVLPAMLARLGMEEAGIEVEIVALNEVQNLLRRDADIAIRMVRPSQNELIARKVTDIPLRAVRRVTYPRPARPAIDAGRSRRPRPDRLRPQRRDDPRLRALPAKVTRHSFRLRSDSHVVLWEAVRAGNGIGIGQAPLIAHDPTVEVVLPDLPLPALPVWLAMHRDVRSSVRIRRVADFLHDELKRYSAAAA